MLSRISAPYNSCDAKDLYLLDANIIYSICSQHDRHKAVWKGNRYQEKIAEAIMSGYAAGGVVTDIVIGELDRIAKNGDERFFLSNLERIVNDPKIRLSHFSMDYKKDAETAGMFDYLKKNIASAGRSNGSYDEGEVSVLMAAYETGIRTVVTDDGDVLKNNVRNYMKNKMREKFGMRGDRQFRVVRSEDFCREIGV